MPWWQLTCFTPMISFYTPWKQPVGVFQCFQGVKKEIGVLKWIKMFITFLFVLSSMWKLFWARLCLLSQFKRVLPPWQNSVMRVVISCHTYLSLVSHDTKSNSRCAANVPRSFNKDLLSKDLAKRPRINSM